MNLITWITWAGILINGVGVFFVWWGRRNQILAKNEQIRILESMLEYAIKAFEREKQRRNG
jgi:hypothetical protein